MRSIQVAKLRQPLTNVIFQYNMRVERVDILLLEVNKTVGLKSHTNLGPLISNGYRLE